MLVKNTNLAIVAIVFLCYGGVQLQVNAAECYDCDSSVENCLQNVAAVEKFCDDKDKGCFVQVDSTGKVTRGCLGDKTDCSTTSETCKSCTGNKCNAHNVCKSCDSANDVDCAITNSATLASAICPAADTKCAIVIDATKLTTQRRCATGDDVTKCNENAQLCKICDGGNCNALMFPSDRRQCYTCGLDQNQCMDVVTNSDVIKSTSCALYKSDDKCYTYAESDENGTKMQRGCVSNANDANKCKDPNTNAACVTCNTDGCNNLKYKYDQRLMCIQCTSKDNANCAWGQALSSAANCKNQILYNQKAACYTEKRDNVLYRGCLHDRDVALGNCEGENCTICDNSDGCNNKDSGVYTCIRCRSDDTPDCKNNADKLTGTECGNMVTESTKGCFHGIWNGIVIRGCKVDMNERMEVICNDPKNNQCKTCDNQANCNAEKTSGANTGAASIILLAFALVTLMKLH